MSSTTSDHVPHALPTKCPTRSLEQPLLTVPCGSIHGQSGGVWKAIKDSKADASPLLIVSCLNAFVSRKKTFLSRYRHLGTAICYCATNCFPIEELYMRETETVFREWMHLFCEWIRLFPECMLCFAVTNLHISYQSMCCGNLKTRP